MDQSKKKSSSFIQNFSEKTSRALRANSKWNDKDEFLDVVYWIRQVIGLICGILWGFLALKGFVAILLYVILNAIIIYIYSISFQQVDEDEYGGVWEIIKEGFMTSFSTFLVFWIVVYSALHTTI